MADSSLTPGEITHLIHLTELDIARAKAFWSKYGHPLTYALISLVSAVIGHAL